jgi:anti-sigma B factor antagonist
MTDNVERHAGETAAQVRGLLFTQRGGRYRPYHDRNGEHSVGELEITVTTGETGPVMTLSGESDQSVTGQLRDALDALVSGGAQHVTVDVSRLRFADSAAITVLLEADRALKRAGGFLELLFPQPVVAVAMHLMGVDRILTIRPQADTGTGGADADASLLMALLIAAEQRGLRG